MLSANILLSLAAVPALVSAAPVADKEVINTAKFIEIANSDECQNWRPRHNPYRHEVVTMRGDNAEGVREWLQYYSLLPEQCHPKPYDLAIADGKSVEDAKSAQAAYEQVIEKAKEYPMGVDSFSREIYFGKTPAQAYLHWIQNRKGWSIYEWQP